MLTISESPAASRACIIGSEFLWGFKGVDVRGESSAAGILGNSGYELRARGESNCRPVFREVCFFFL